jgi:CDP-glycerol glycerophosphotransferase
LLPIEILISFLDFFYPKDNKTILFGSNTGEFVTGSPKALFEYINNNHPDEYDVFYYLPFHKTFRLNERMNYILRLLPIFFKAKFLVSSHPPTDFFPLIAWSRKKVFINTWHGTPIKSIFFADLGETKEDLERIVRMNTKTSAFLVASDLEARLIERCFKIDPNKLCYLGHPRNDILLKNNNQRKLPVIVKNLPEYQTIILYCPTYRRDAPTTFFPFNDLDVKHLNCFLKKNKILLLVRGHVYSRYSEKPFFSKRIIDFSFEVLNDVNEILPEVDLLVTDYSSIYIDYLLLDRPCIFIPYDLENYKRKRGLLLDYNAWTPGRKVVTYRQFVVAVEEILSGVDLYKGRRQELIKQFHCFQTENSCEKVFKLLDGWKNEKP